MSVDPKRARVKFADYAGEWIAERPLRDRTREVYASILKVDVVPEFGASQLNGITTDRVRRLAKPKPTMAPKAYRLLRTILTTAVDDGVLIENTCKVRGAASEKADERRIPSPNEVEKVAAAIDPRYSTAALQHGRAVGRVLRASEGRVLRPGAAAREAGGSLTSEVRGRAASSPDNDGTDWYCQTVRARLAGRSAHVGG